MDNLIVAALIILADLGAYMRIALISPYSIGPTRGNIITVQRISNFLNKEGVTTVIIAVDNLSINKM